MVAGGCQVRLDNGFDLGDDLAVKLFGVIGRTSTKGYLEQQFEWHLVHRQIKNIRPVGAEV